MKKPTIFFALISILILLVWLALPELAAAQTPPPPPVKPTQTPIDGGLTLLAAAGGAYAVKKLRDRKD